MNELLLVNYFLDDQLEINLPVISVSLMLAYEGRLEITKLLFSLAWLVW